MSEGTARVVNNEDKSGGLAQLSTVTKLDKTNYQEWKEDVEIELKLRRIYQAITEDGTDEFMDLKARRILLETMDKEHRAQVRGCKTAKQVWERLELSYAEATAARKYRLLNKFFRSEKEDGVSIDAHIGKLDGMRADLESMSVTIDEDIFLATVIGSLPSEFGNVMETWELADPSQRTKQNLIAKLLNKESDLKTNTSGTVQGVFFAKAKGRRTQFSSKEIEERKKVTRCGNCKKVGHWHRECPGKGNEETNMLEPDSRSYARRLNVVLNVGVAKADLKNKWVADSGATNHMTNSRKWLVNYQEFNAQKQATVGDGKVVEVYGKGDFKFSCKTNGEVISFTLTGVLYIPSLATNLLSIGAAAERGIETSFSKEKCYLKKGKMTLITGSKVDDLYVLDMMDPEKIGNTFYVSQKKLFQEWHRPLGHPSAERTRQTLKDQNIDAKPEELQCADCPAGKAKRASHPQVGKDRADEVGQLVHIDLVHSDNKSNKFCYYMLSKDEASEFCMVHFLSSKTDVHEALQQLIIDFEKGSDKQIRGIQTDNGSEFLNRKVELILLREKIHHNRSIAYTAETNGLIERAVQSINDMARTILLTPKLSTKLKNEAIRTAVYLSNRLPTKRSNLSPYERFTGRKPNIKHLVSFGEEVHILINDEYKRKFDARTRQGFVVGYTPRSNAYRVYVPDKGTVIETADVYFKPHLRTFSEGKHNSLDSVEMANDGITENSQTLSLENLTQLNTTSSEPIERENQQDSPTDRAEEQECPASQTGPKVANTARNQRVSKDDKPYVSAADLEEFFASLRHDEDRSVHDQSRNSEVDEGNRDGNEGQNRPQTTIERISDKISKLFLMANEADKSPHEPSTYEEAVSGPNNKQWLEAIKNEFQANGTWTVCRRPKTGTALSTKWIFKLKKDSRGQIERFKARLVARGYEQRAGIDFKETYAPVAALESIRVMLAVVAIKRLKFVQFDVQTAFLNGRLEETVYIEPPKGLEIDEECCLKLNRALYGLKQAPRAWSSKFDETLNKMGFKSLVSDRCIYSTDDHRMTIITYVDDGLVIGPTKRECEEVVVNMSRNFKTKIIEGSIFLGLEIKEEHGEGLSLKQSRYIEEIANRFNQTNSRCPETPLADTKSLLEIDNDAAMQAPYREAIGSLLYVALNTRPDVLFATILLSRFNNQPQKKHWHAVQRLIKFMVGTKNRKLLLFPGGDAEKLRIDTYTDADWGGDRNTGMSTTGVIVMLNQCAVVFKSSRQKCVALSTCEAEFIAACEGLKQTLWIVNLLEELGLLYNCPILHIDNLPTIKAINSNGPTKLLKHICLKQRFICDQVRNQKVKIEHVETKNQLADILTKAVNRIQHEALSKKIGLVEKR